MKGIIVNLLERVVIDDHGADVWDDLLESTGSAGSYTTLGNYPDAEVVGLVAALAQRTGSDVPAVLRHFGRAALGLLAQRYPIYFESSDPVAFVLTVEDVIHAEVVKLYPGATPPRLECRDVAADAVTIEYSSQRAMSDLAMGFLEGTAQLFGQTVAIDRTMLDPDGTRVDLRCVFSPA